MRLLDWRVVNKTLKFRLTLLILSRGKLIVKNIRNVRRNLSVLYLRRARQANEFDHQQC